MSTKFKIAFDGNLRQGVDQAQVVAQLVSRFRMPEDKAARLFAGERTILKKGLDSKQAQNYVRQLAAIGMELEALAEADGDGLAPPVAAGAEAVGGDYRIVFAGGLLDGHSRDVVMAAARERLKLGDGQLAQVFSGRELGLKRGLDEAGARRYLELLRGLGMNAWSDPPLGATTHPAAVAEVPAAAGADAPGRAAEDADAHMSAAEYRAEPSVQDDSEDDVERRLLEAMSAEFELPAPPGQEAGSGGDGDEALQQMAATMLNADALMMYEHEIAEAESRMMAQVAEIAPNEAEAAAEVAGLPETAPSPADDPPSGGPSEAAAPSENTVAARPALDQTMVVAADDAAALAAAVRAAAPAPAPAPTVAATAAVSAPAVAPAAAAAGAPAPIAEAAASGHDGDDTSAPLKLALLVAALALAGLAAWLVIGP